MIRTHALFRLSALGDLVLCTAVLQKIAAEAPAEDEIFFFTQTAFVEFLKQHAPQRVRVIALERPAIPLWGWILQGFRAWSLAHSESREWVFYDLHGVVKSVLFAQGLRLAAWKDHWKSSLVRNLRIKRVAKRGFARILSVLLGRDLIGPRHLFREHLLLVDPDPLSPSRHTPKLELGPHFRSSKSGHTGFRLLAAPDAQHWKKRWLIPHWEILLRTLLNEYPDASVTLVGGAEALPRDLRDDMKSVYGARLNDQLGKLNLLSLAQVAADHDITVCGNSAWLHISEAVGTPVIALAGPVVPGFGFSPWKPESIELSVSLDCRPCTRHGGGRCRKQGQEFHACMKRIEPAEVLQCLQKRGLRVEIPSP